MSTEEMQETVQRYPDQPKTSAEILEAVRALGPLIEKTAPTGRAQGRMPDEMTEALREAGVLRSAFPAMWGGPQMSLVDQMTLIDEIAYHDASTAWTTMILFDSGFFAGNYPFEIAREVFPSMDMGVAVSQYPLGRADLEGDEYRINAHLKFGSGSYNADVIFCPCVVHVDGEPKLDADGNPVTGLFPFAGKDVTIHDGCWNTVGLQGTGSTDYSVKDGMVPARHMFLFDETKINEDLPPLSRYHRLIVPSQYSVLLGLTRRMMDEMHEVMNTRITTANPRPLKDDPLVQMGVMEAQAMYEAARAYAYEWCRVTDDMVFNHDHLTREQAARISMIGPTIATLCRKAVDLCLEWIGTDAIHAERPWEKWFQDFRVGAAHVVFRRPSYRKVLLDLRD